jgi:hypothetical protein
VGATTAGHALATWTYPAQLLKAYNAAPELEKLGHPALRAPVAALSTSAPVCFWSPTRHPSTRTQLPLEATLTRRETRFMALAAVDAVLDSRRSKGWLGNQRQATIIQELLGRGVKTVLRVGYKNRLAHLR